ISRSCAPRTFTTCHVIRLPWHGTLRISWAPRKLPVRTRLLILICLTFSHKPIIWRCWCGSDVAYEAAFTLPCCIFRGRDIPLARSQELCLAESENPGPYGAANFRIRLHHAPPELDLLRRAG